MINSIVELDVGKATFIFATSSENNAKLINDTKDAKKNLPYNLYQIWNDELQYGSILGANNHKIMLCNHMSCRGVHCECKEFASIFFSHSGELNLFDYLLSIQEFLSSTIIFPYLMILINGKELISVSNYAEGDFQISMIEPKSYAIRYNILYLYSIFAFYFYFTGVYFIFFFYVIMIIFCLLCYKRLLFTEANFARYFKYRKD